MRPNCRGAGSRGPTISAFDAQIAAIAATHGATVVTRDTSNFELCGIDILNPWKT